MLMGTPPDGLIPLFQAEWARVGMSGSEMLEGIWAVDLPNPPSGNFLRTMDHELVFRILRELPDGAGAAGFGAAYRAARTDPNGRLPVPGT